MAESMTRTARARKIFQALYDDASAMRTLWLDARDYAAPNMGHYLDYDLKPREGDRKDKKILNNTATKALGILASGFQSGLASPAIPWFALKHADPQLNEYGPVKEYLHDVRNVILNALARGNFYGSSHSMYFEIGAFGTGAMFSLEDFETSVLFRPLTIGEFYITCDFAGRPNGLYRRFEVTANALAEEFGFDALSDAAKENIKNGTGEKLFRVIHEIVKNPNRDPSKIDFRGQAYRSTYFEVGGDPDKILREKGYRTRPFTAPRWLVIGTNRWGISPTIDNIGDIRQLQQMERDKLTALAQMIKPTMNAPASMKGKTSTVVPGGINYLDQARNEKFEPSFLVRPDLQNMAFEIERVETRIKLGYYNDLFASILGADKNMTAAEVARRYEEKLVLLGPVTDRLQTEHYDPAIERTYNILLSQGRLPPAPPELQGQELKIEYISLLAQAQKMVHVMPISQTVSFAGSLAAVNPDVLDKIDFDEAVDQYADAVGAPPKIVRTDEEVAAIRAAKQAAVQQQQAAQSAMSMVQGAKTLSETKTNQNSALDAIMGGLR